MTAFTSSTLEIEFTAGVWTDLTSRLAMRVAPVRIRMGRPTEYDDVAAGTLTCALFNDDGALMPDNAGSAYYPNVVEGKRIRWRVTKAAVTYTRFIGWIQAWTPDFPGESTHGAVVSITATDALGLLAQRQMRSNLTEVSLWRARNDTTWCDAYEATGSTAGQIALLTNYSGDASPGAPSAIYAAADSSLTFGSENDLSTGGIVSAGGEQTSKTILGFQSTALQIKWHLKGPTSQVSVGVVYYALAFMSGVAVLAVAQNGANNGLYLRNSSNTATVGLIGNIPLGQWVEIVAYSRAANPARSDWYLIFTDGTSSPLSDVAVDIRNIVSCWIPGNTTPSLSCSIGGVVALGSRTPINWQEAFTGVSAGALSGRIATFASAVSLLPITISTIGTLTTTVATGRWSDRSGLDVLAEMLRTGLGLPFARQRDSVVYAIGSDQLNTATPVATIDTDADCVGAPTLVHGTEARPTRIDVEWPGGIAPVIDRTAELAGKSRSKRVSTVAATLAVATAVGADIMAKRQARPLRISRVVLSLVHGATDFTATLFDEGTTLGALFPTRRIRTVLPTTHFGVPTRDHYVQGWEEVYAPNDVTISLDTTPAVTTTIVSTLTFTAADGSGLPGSWDSLFSVAASGSTAVQSNRARETTAADALAEHYVRSGVTWTDGDLVATCIPGTLSRAVVQVRAVTATTLGTGYRLTLDAVNNQLILDRTASTVATAAKTLTAGTSYGIRMRVIGAYVNIRVWPSAGAEPGTWDIAYVDGAPLTGDRWCIGCRADGTNATARSADFDDITITDGA